MKVGTVHENRINADLFCVCVETIMNQSKKEKLWVMNQSFGAKIRGSRKSTVRKILEKTKIHGDTEVQLVYFMKSP
jgi:hypothetical protein